MGDYHSKIILNSFFKGKNQFECYQSFNDDTYRRFEFYDEFEKSVNELKTRELHLDFSFCDEFLEIIQNKPSLYTTNHPLPFIFHQFSNFIAQKLGLIHYELPFDYLENFLAMSAWWPIYPEIARYHQLKYETPLLFKQPNPKGGKLLTLELLIQKSYTHYQSIKDNLCKAEQVKKIMEF